MEDLIISRESQEILDIISRDIDEVTLSIDAITSKLVDNILSESNLSELTLGEIGEKLKKGWDLLVGFFRKVLDYINDKIRGRVHNLNLKLVMSGNEGKIEYYSKMQKFKTLEFDKSDKFRCVDVEAAYNIINKLTKDINNANFSEAKEYNDINSVNFSEAKKKVKGVGISKTKKDKKDNKSNNNNNKNDNSGFKKQEFDIENAYVNVRETVIKEDQPSSSLGSYINGINRYYQRSIDAVSAVSQKCIRNAKSQPGKVSYRKFVTAKNVTNAILSINNLIKIQNEN